MEDYKRATTLENYTKESRSLTTNQEFKAIRNYCQEKET